MLYWLLYFSFHPRLSSSDMNLRWIIKNHDQYLLFQQHKMLRLSVKISKLTYQPIVKFAETQLKYYQYFLHNTFPPTIVSTIQPDMVPKINNSALIDLHTRLVGKYREGRLNYDMLNRNVKVRIYLIYEMAHRNNRWFFLFARWFLQDVNRNQIDFKYSQLYEEKAIFKLVQIAKKIEDDQFDNQSVICQLCLFLFEQNKILQDRIASFKNMFQSYQDLTVFDYFRDNKSEHDGIQKNLYPNKLFAYLNRQHIYTDTYNNHVKRKAPISFDQSYQAALNVQIQQTKEELKEILSSEALKLQNCKITRLDYLSASNLLIQRGVFSDAMLSNLIGYIRQDNSRRQTRKIGLENRVEEVLFILRIINNLYKLNDKMIEENRMVDITKMYVNYVSQYEQCLAKLTVVSYHRLLHDSTHIFRNYIVVQFLPFVNIQSICQSYLLMFDQILNMHGNGNLLYQNTNANFIFETLIILSSHLSNFKLQKYLQRYQNYLIMYGESEIVQKTQIINMPALAALHFKVKSDVIANLLYQKIQTTTDKQKWKDKIKPIKKRNNNLYHFDTDQYKFKEAFIYYLVLEIGTSYTSEVAKKSKQKLFELFSNINYPTILSSHRSKVKLSYGGINKLNDPIKSFFFEGQQNKLMQQLSISKINKIFMIMAKLVQLHTKQNIQQLTIIEDTLQSILSNQHYQQTCLNHIAYPHFYYHVFQLAHQLQAKDRKLGNVFYKFIGELKIFANKYIQLNQCSSLNYMKKQFTNNFYKLHSEEWKIGPNRSYEFNQSYKVYYVNERMLQKVSALQMKQLPTQLPTQRPTQLRTQLPIQLAESTSKQVSKSSIEQVVNQKMQKIKNESVVIQKQQKCTEDKEGGKQVTNIIDINKGNDVVNQIIQMLRQKSKNVTSYNQSKDGEHQSYQKNQKKKTYPWLKTTMKKHIVPKSLVPRDRNTIVKINFNKFNLDYKKAKDKKYSNENSSQNGGKVNSKSQNHNQYNKSNINRQPVKHDLNNNQFNN